MRNRNASILLRGTAFFLLIVATFLAISSLISYSRQRNDYPPGMSIGGVPVGGLDPQAASQRVLQVYTSPVEIRYGGGVIHVDPTTLGFPPKLVDSPAALRQTTSLASGSHCVHRIAPVQRLPAF